jgi:hypothetical protein
MDDRQRAHVAPFLHRFGDEHFGIADGLPRYVREAGREVAPAFGYRLGDATLVRKERYPRALVTADEHATRDR